ncbi:MAG: hypothetical protein JNL06_18390 [Alphaproteobacteria bacterium]|nr:hypothetical protein [Alphaproteobacteria bacterium]
MALAVVQIEALRVGGVVADDDVEVAVRVEVDDVCGIRAVGRGAEIVPFVEMSLAVAEQNAIGQRPVAALGEDEI